MYKFFHAPRLTISVSRYNGGILTYGQTKYKAVILNATENIKLKYGIINRGKANEKQ